MIDTDPRAYALTKHDIFTLMWANEKILLGMPIIIHKVFYKKIWYRPFTWFKKCYTIEYIGDNLSMNFEKILYDKTNYIMKE